MKIIGETIGYMLLKGLKYGAILGAVYGTAVYILIGTLYGLFIGAVMGLILGLVDGLIIGLVTWRFFNPVQEAKQFRWTVVILAAIVTYGGAVIFLLRLYSLSALSDYFVQVPALLAAAGATHAAFRFIRHYLKKHATLAEKLALSSEIAAPLS